MNRKAVIVSAKRTPIGKIGGVLRSVPPEELTAALIRDLLAQTKVAASEIDDIFLGNTVGPGGNLARLSGLTAGLSVSVPGVTVDRQCGSGLEAIILAARQIQAGAGDVYLAGGAESTSLAPWKFAKPASLYELPKPYGRARFSPDFIGDPEMGEAAENVASVYGVTREEQDAYALRSHQKAIVAIDEGRFNNEITPIQVETENGVKWVKQDECPRRSTSLEKLSRLKPVFRKDGSVTAGNACPINDGAALALIMSEEKAIAYGLTPILEFMDAAVCGVDPNLLGIGPIPAVEQVLKRQSLTINDLAYIEFNEAFASQVIASLKELTIPYEKVNAGGGALALGHPYGASGAVLVTRLCAEAWAFRGGLGLATLGIGGGLGLAALFRFCGE
ncbi:thiolase family protein [Pullulanibacillus sp. KACC 23026]|uniref:thiolase family protein n=1 Tax=Pullulanibacillus sp. KACC 23026 TaxID=3028315 RepID=UPI0023B11494|nr:thiolase family protein [Pullulanibacillus sp. KACC 23026]WEG14357.1 thiolase family protein [Pullulanibacillus sp. KACC 23026]